MANDKKLENKQKSNVSKQYTDESIRVLPFPDCIQQRPTMYIGELGINGCNHLFREVLDNAVDEFLNGFGTTIKVKISNKEGYAEIKDNGRGIPPNSIEKAFCTLHSSGKFDNNQYAVSAGSNGVGTSAVNALSTKFIVNVYRDGFHYKQEFANGKKTTKVKQLEKTNATGTAVLFYPNVEIMEEVKFDIDFLKNEMNMKTYINKNLTIEILDVDKNEKTVYKHKNGISDYLDTYCKKQLTGKIYLEDTLDHTFPSKKSIKVAIETSFVYSKNSSIADIKSFCNSLHTSDGGTHVTGFKMALTSIIKKYIDNKKLRAKRDEKLDISGDDITDGLYAVISIKHPCPKFDSQTKNKLSSSEVQGLLIKFMTNKFNDWLDTHEQEAKLICNKIILTARASEAAKKAKDLVSKKNESTFSAISDISKLSNCISKDPEETELFIVEGNSAGGTAQACRDKQFQAIYALRGKPLNSHTLDVNKIVSNKELSDLIYVLTGKRGAIQENFSIDDLKYHKICILADADSDGKHIASLLTNFFYQHCREIIEHGCLYETIPPLYSIIERGKKRYFVNQEDYDNFFYEKLAENYTFIINKKSYKSISNIKKICLTIEKYKSYLKNIDDQTGISMYLIDQVNVAIKKKKVNNDSQLKKYLTSIGDFNIENNEVNGIFHDKFLTFSLDKFKEILGEVKQKKIPLISIKTKENKIETLTLFKYDSIIKQITPKSRNRMKGLGEMSADELWDTTMCPQQRSLKQIQISDVERADTIMDDLLNPKNTDKRKVFLMKNQKEVNINV